MFNSGMFNQANILTMLRIVLSFLFLAFFYSTNLYWYYFAVFLFIIAAITDLLDGHIARSQQLVSDFGKLIDPLADKILLCCGLFPLVDIHMFPSFAAVIIVTREFAVSGLRTLAAKNHSIIAANRMGKYKTTFQLSVVITILVVHGFQRTITHFYGSVEAMQRLYSPWLSNLFWWIKLEINFLIWATLFITVLSAVDYFRRYLPVLQQSSL